MRKPQEKLKPYIAVPQDKQKGWNIRVVV